MIYKQKSGCVGLLTFYMKMLKKPKFVLAITWKVLVRQLCAQQQNCVIFDDLSDDTHPVSVASVVFELLIFRKKGCHPDPVNSWTVKIVWVYLLYGSWFYNFMKISVKNDNRSWVIIANVLSMFMGSERVLIFRTLKFFQATQDTYLAI